LGGIHVNLLSPLVSVFLPLNFTVVKKDTPEVDLMPQLLHRFKVHEHGGESEPELTMRQGAFWARRRS